MSPLHRRPRLAPGEVSDPLQAARRRALSVSQATRALRQVLEGQFADLWVEGEISNFHNYRSGHWYFTLKDNHSQLPAVMFAGDNRRLQFDIKDGMQVLARGRVSYYEAGGRAQVIVRQLEPSGEGARAQALKQRAAKLAAEGLFGADRKTPLPLLPRRLGVVTSPSGAAVRDILRVARRRCPRLPVLIAPTRVQGEGADAEVARALRRLDDSGLCDVIIVGRGGGSSEDLEIFSSEVVVRAVAACRTPVVSAVGHEVDTSLCDLAADLRAATPSAAAERVVPEQQEIEAHIRGLQRTLLRRFEARSQQARGRLATARARLGDPRALVLAQRQNLDAHLLRAEGALRRQIARGRARQQASMSRLRARSPQQQTARARAQYSELYHHLLDTFTAQLAHRRQRLATGATTLSALSPLAVLGRGYAICTHGGRVVSASSQLAPGDRIALRLHQGRLSAAVLDIEAATKSASEPR